MSFLSLVKFNSNYFKLCDNVVGSIHRYCCRCFMKSGEFYPKLPLNFVGGNGHEAIDELDSFSVEEPATGQANTLYIKM